MLNLATVIGLIKGFLKPVKEEITDVKGDIQLKQAKPYDDPIKDIQNGVYLTGFFSNYPTKQIIDDMFRFLNENNIEPQIGKVVDFADICEAVIAQDSGKVNGKIIVKTSD